MIIDLIVDMAQKEFCQQIFNFKTIALLSMSCFPLLCTGKSYLFDWPLPVNCPELVKDLKIPKYFANDFLQRTPSGSLYRESWPSLFMAPAGITSELHVDAFGSNFWMALFEGQKRYTNIYMSGHPQLLLILTNYAGKKITN